MPHNRVPFSHPWAEDVIGNVASVTVGGTPRTTVAKYWGGNVPWMSSGDVHLRRIFDVPGRITEAGLQASNAKIVQPPAVAIGLAGQGKTRGTAALALVPICTNQSVALIQGIPSRLDTLYLFHNLDFRYEELRGRSAGGGRAGLSKEILEMVPVPLPEVEEQSAIARVLDTVDAAIARAELIVEKLRRIKAGLLRDLLTHGIDEHGDLRDPDRRIDTFHDVPGVGLVPKDWDVVELADVVPIAEYGISSPLVRKGELPVLRMNNIVDGSIDATDITFASEDVPDQLLLRPRDVLFNRTNSIEHVGKTAIWMDELPKATFASYLVRLVCDTDRLMPEFLSLWLNWDQTQIRIREFATIAVQQVNINPTNLRRTRIAIPKDLQEQSRIAASYECIRQQVQREAAALAKLRQVKTGLMQDLLTGLKRVPVDLIHADSPAIAEQPREKKANIYFMRSVLAAEIVEQLHEHATFGHVKFQKTLFLCERMAGLDLETHYHRAAAGPHDNRLMRSVDGQMKKQKWFRAVPRGVGSDGKPVGWAYERMEKAGGHREWFEKYWAAARERIQRVIDLLRPFDTDRCQIIATLYSAWEDLLATGREATDDTIVNEVLTNWHESKQAIPRERWAKALAWMREKDLVPAATQS